MSYTTINELADCLRVSRRTVERLLHSHKVATVHVGRQVRIPLEEVEKLITRKEVAA